MTNPDIVEIVAIVDSSGSMQSIKGAAIAGFNALLYDQQTLMNAADAIFTLVFFNSVHYMVYDAVDIGEVKPLTPNTYECDGNTAMYDAIGDTITRVHNKFKDMPEDEIPGTILFVIITDGGENDSHNYKGSLLKEMITRLKREDNWMFSYLSSTNNPYDEAEQIGIPNEDVLKLRTGAQGMQEGYVKISTAYSNYRTGKSKKVNL
ncbi:MAG: hypothetical protein WC877_00790 [Dehalococcoidales bacterium]|jgi:uncharacterized protein YegL